MAETGTKHTESTAIVSADLGIINTIGKSIGTWLKRAEEFLKGCDVRDVKASEMVTQMEALKVTPSVTPEDDERVQITVRGMRGEKTEAEAYYQDVTQGLDKLHKLVVGRRKTTVGKWDRAIELGTAEHTRFKREADRAAAEEQERNRIAAENEAKAKRQKELDALEAQALKAEADTPDLSEREQKFVDAYCAPHTVHGQMSQEDAQKSRAIGAARTAGYQNPETRGLTLLKTPKIVTAIDAKLRASAIRHEAAQVKNLPPETVVTQAVKPAIIKAATDRQTWSAELLDEAALIKAIDSGDHPEIPKELIVKSVDKVMLNKFAVRMHEEINAWPGVRAKSKDTIL